MSKSQHEFLATLAVKERNKIGFSIILSRCLFLLHSSIQIPYNLRPGEGEGKLSRLNMPGIRGFHFTYTYVFFSLSIFLTMVSVFFLVVLITHYYRINYALTHLPNMFHIEINLLIVLPCISSSSYFQCHCLIISPPKHSSSCVSL